MKAKSSALEIIPRHIALIMDGNGRWAKINGKSRIDGHREGTQSVRSILKTAFPLGIEIITIYAFSTENWKRPAKEIQGLMKLMTESLNSYEKDLHDNKIRLRVMGELEKLPKSLRTKLEKTMNNTKTYSKHTLVIALNYGARTEITNATRKIAQLVAENKLKPKDITEKHICNNLYLPDIPDPELMIRTSGELRLSNFMLWQISYTEIIITDKLWPEFREQELYDALEQYNKRQRRFGGIEDKEFNDG